MIKPNIPVFRLPKGKTTFLLGEIFCGPGGIALGATKASIRAKGGSLSIRHAWASDWDEDTCATYLHNILLQKSYCFCARLQSPLANSVGAW